MGYGLKRMHSPGPWAAEAQVADSQDSVSHFIFYLCYLKLSAQINQHNTETAPSSSCGETPFSKW